MMEPMERHGPRSGFHVTSALNRESIARHGLDWTRMGAATGIAGSLEPEQAGCFIALDEWETKWFVRMGMSFGPVDVWEVNGVSHAELVESSEGHHYIARIVPPERLRLLRTDVTADE